MMKLLDMDSEARILNNYTFTMYYHRLKLLVLSIHEYENLPNNMKEEWIEKILYHEGRAMFFEAKDSIGLMVSKVTHYGLNHYEEPISLRPVANNYYDVKDYKVGEECVLIKNNDLSLPSDYEVRLFAYRLANLTRTQDINVDAQKTPVLIRCTDKQKLTLKNVYKQYKGNEPVIFGDKYYDLDGFEVLKTDAPIVFDKLQLQKHQVMNEFLTLFGINNANMDKKERVVDDEVQANNEEVNSFSQMLLKTRKQAVKEINELFGTNISVKKRVLNLADFGLDMDGNLTGSENDSKGSENEVA